MSPVAARPRPAPPRRGSDILGVFAAGVGLVVALGVLLLATEAAPHVERVMVDNPHEWSAGVEASDETRQGWVGMGVVNNKVTQSFEEVLDQGGTWVFRFSYGGVDGGELTVSRADLQRSGWKITVPDEFPARMREAGLGPSPR